MKKTNVKNSKVLNEVEQKQENKDEIVQLSNLSKQDIKAIKKIKKKKSFSFLSANRVDADYKTGLTQSQVKQRITDGFVNYTETHTTKSYKNIFFSNIFTFFNMLMFLVAIALILVKSYSNLLFLVILFCNTTIGIIQEIKAKQTVEKITLVTSPTVKVVRDGKTLTIKTNAVVLDDILIYEFGQQICTDSIILNGTIEVNESLLTGESVPVEKKVGDMILAGSYVTSGFCYARAEKVAEENYTSQLTIKAKKYNKPKSELLRSLQLIIKLIGIFIIPLSLATYFNNKAILGGDIQSLVTKTAGSILGMIPAGLFLLTSLALAVGVIKLAKKKTLVQDLYGIEILARTNVLCLDKTGTITDGTMQVKQIKMLKEENDLHNILSTYLSSMKTQNQTFNALKNYFGEKKAYEVKKVYEFNSSKKYSAVEFDNGKTYILGAPEFVYKSKNKALKKQILDYATEGNRVLMLCESTEPMGKNLPKTTPVCLLMIEENIREEAKQTISWFNENNVQIKIISGDNPLTVSAISKKVGVVGAEKYISLEGLTTQQVIACATKYNIFGRATPEQKQVLVKALKNAGLKVAMTGDGVNDILALKEADCSISVSSGSEAARNVSHLVLLDNNFLNLPQVVKEGRRVVNNIVISANLFLMKTIYVLLLTMFCLIFKLEYPFAPTQMLLLETFVIGLPSFFLALQPNNNKIEGSFIKKVLVKSLCYGVVLFVTFIACYLFDILVVHTNTYETLASLSMTFVGMAILFQLCVPINLYRGTLFISMLAVTLLSLFILPASLFYYTKLSLVETLFVIVVTLLSFVVVFIPQVVSYKKQKE